MGRGGKHDASQGGVNGRVSIPAHHDQCRHRRHRGHHIQLLREPEGSRDLDEYLGEGQHQGQDGQINGAILLNRDLTIHRKC